MTEDGDMPEKRDPALPEAEPMPEPATRNRAAERAERKAADLARGREKFQERARQAAEGVNGA